MDKHKEKQEKLLVVQTKFENKIKEYFKSNKDFEDYIIDVKFKIDFNFNEYFIISFGQNLDLLLECEKIPYLRWCNNEFPHWWDLKNVSNLLSKLSAEQETYIDLIKFAEQYFKESQVILDEYK